MPKAILSKAGAWRRSLLAVALCGLVALAACDRILPGRFAPSAPAGPRSGELIDRVRVFLISPGDAGRSGRKVACDDSAVAVDIALGEKQPGLAGALTALLALQGRYHQSSGLYNALDGSHLQLVRIVPQAGALRVDLAGYLELGGGCDNRRILAELTETARQFADAGKVEFFLDDRALAAILAAQAPP